MQWLDIQEGDRFKNHKELKHFVLSLNFVPENPSFIPAVSKLLSEAKRQNKRLEFTDSLWMTLAESKPLAFHLSQRRDTTMQIENGTHLVTSTADDFELVDRVISLPLENIQLENAPLKLATIKTVQADSVMEMESKNRSPIDNLEQVQTKQKHYIQKRGFFSSKNLCKTAAASAFVAMAAGLYLVNSL